MSDWPAARYHKPVISSFSAEAIGLDLALSMSATGGSAVWPSANLAMYVPFVLAASYLVKKVWWANGTAVAGNVDCGVFTVGGTKILSSGATAQAGTTAIQSVTLGTAMLLTPGSYYMALAASSASATFWRSAGAIAGTIIDLQMAGMAQQATAEPLPATFTLATTASLYVPYFGIARSGVI